MWTKSGDPPWELISYVLRRDIYHCTAEELEQADMREVLNDLAIRRAIAKVSET